MTKEKKINDVINYFVQKLKESRSPLPDHPGFRSYLNDLAYYLNLPDREERMTLFPCLGDKTTETQIDKFYFYQDTWAARKIFQIRPRCVVDVGSSALFVGIISQLIPTISVDVRPLTVTLPGLTCKQASITDLPFESHSIEFLTSMCVIEHVGLGRYGDKLDTNGSIKAFSEVSRVIEPGGNLLFSAPLSHTPGLAFNAHRIFSKKQLMNYLPDFSLRDELFLFPEPGEEKNIKNLNDFEFICWCAHMVKHHN